MFSLILYFPFISFILNVFLGFALGKGCLFLPIICMGLSLFSVFFCFYEVFFCGAIISIELGSWFELISGGIFIKWNFLFDTLTLSMCFIIVLISFFVHLYSLSYMKGDPFLYRFLSFLSFFTFCMLMLVTSGNAVQMFLGWEGVGVASYLLISFWYSRVFAVKAALKAMLMNKVGDISLLIAFILLFITFGSFDYNVLFSLVYTKTDVFCLNLISFFLFLGAMGKSAQLGLHTWLPDAMEGPTPVSALIHAATMVTAGVFLVIRFSFIFILCPNIMQFIILVGSCTAFFAASVALFQVDVKKVIAYSTCSQLGYMFFSCGLMYFDVGLFHLVNHAFFKALLFLSSGVIIHALLDEQDIRKFGGLGNILPFTYIMVVIGSLALVGFPFLTGFYSKDLILELSLGSYVIAGTFSYGLGLIGAFFTSFYSFRLINFIFLIKPISRKLSLVAHEGSAIMLFCLFVLSCFSLYFGFLFKEAFVGLGTDVFYTALSVNKLFMFETEYLSVLKKNLPLFVTLVGMFFAFSYTDFYIPVAYWSRCYFFSNSKIYLYSYYGISFLACKWYFDILYNKISLVILHMSFSFLTLVDRGFIEYFGPFFAIFSLKHCFIYIRTLHSGLLYHYGYIFSFCTLSLILFLGQLSCIY